MAINYEYYYATLDLETGMCLGVQDTSNYIIRRDYVPIDEPNGEYLLKFYYPIPESVNSFDDFQGSWYEDAAHTIPWNP